MARRKRLKGLHDYRLKDNPAEAFALELWTRQHPGPYEDRGTLPYLLGDGSTPVDPSERDWLVANTVIQWLGSPIGQNLVEELYERIQKLRSPFPWRGP